MLAAAKFIEEVANASCRSEPIGDDAQFIETFPQRQLNLSLEQASAVIRLHDIARRLARDASEEARPEEDINEIERGAEAIWALEVHAHKWSEAIALTETGMSNPTLVCEMETAREQARAVIAIVSAR